MQERVEIELPFLPLVNFQRLLSPARKQELPVVQKGLSELGFLLLQNCIDPTLVKEAYEQMQLFFELPMNTKMIFKMDDRYRGYDPGEQTLQMQNLTSAEAAQLKRDKKEGYRIWDPAQEAVSKDVPWWRLLGHPNKFPSKELLPDFIPIMLAYREAGANAICEIMNAIDDCPDISPGNLKDYNDPGFMPCRPILYSEDGGSSNAHQDWGNGTLIDTNVPGLQTVLVSEEAEVWYQVPVMEGCSVFQFGEMAAKITGLKANRHRVRMPKKSRGSKLSLVTFGYGHRDKKIGNEYCAQKILDRFDQSYGFGRFGR